MAGEFMMSSLQDCDGACLPPVVGGVEVGGSCDWSFRALFYIKKETDATVLTDVSSNAQSAILST